jgi:hypothetical protein
MLGNLVSGIAAPGSGADEIGRAGQTSSAMMVISAGVEERASTQVAQWMSNKPDLRPTRAAQILGIAPVDSTATSTAARRIKPINQPIKTIRQFGLWSRIHKQSEFNRSERANRRL